MSQVNHHHHHHHHHKQQQQQQVNGLKSSTIDLTVISDLALSYVMYFVLIF